MENDNLYAHFAHRFPVDRGREFLATPDGRRTTYAQMEAIVARHAGALAAMGLRPGDRVTAQVFKSREAVWLYLACLRGGFVYHPLNDAYRREELAYLIADAEPALAVCDPANEPLFRSLVSAGCRVLTLGADGRGSLTDGAREAGSDLPVAQRAADDAAILLYTSGTTGRAKGAVISHGNLASNAEVLVSSWGFTADDRVLHALPLYHAHGLFVGLGCTLMSGARLLFLPRFDAAEVVAEIPHCTVLMGVPTHYARLLTEARLDRASCAGMRLFVSGSAPLSPRVFGAFRERTGHAILERYGMTETGMNTANPLHGERRAGSVGMPLPGVTVRIAAGGEIELRGPNVFAGYWRSPERTAEAFTADGYFRTGDLGWMSADGYLTINGRSKDLIISGGLNVYPREVEAVLDALPGVAESAVIGAVHPDFGEAVVAVVAAAPGAEVAEAGIIDAMRGRLAGYKVPKRVFIVGELPRNAMGKVEKTALRARHARTFTGEGDAP